MTDNRNFKPGDLVRHKDDGSPMTVISVTGDKVHCEWFDESLKVNMSREFAALVLEKYQGLIIDGI